LAARNRMSAAPKDLSLAAEVSWSAMGPLRTYDIKVS
jgi:hypothetical protein